MHPKTPLATYNTTYFILIIQIKYIEMDSKKRIFILAALFYSAKRLLSKLLRKRTLVYIAGLCRGDPLTNRGKRLQLLKILCLTVIPILGVWGFTMHSLSASVQKKSNIEAVISLFL